MLTTIEIGLRGALFLIRLSSLKPKNHYENLFFARLSHSFYQNKDWAKALFDELLEATSNEEYEPYLGWRTKEYHGRYVNVERDGNRKNWNPKNFNDVAPKTLYVFGGSTIWGEAARDDDTIPSHLSKILNQRGEAFIVSNYGEHGFTFTQGVIQLLLLLREGLRPNFVFFYTGFNDIYGAYQSGIAGTIHNLADMREALNEENKTPFQHIRFGIKNLIQEKSLIYRGVADIEAFFSPKPVETGEMASIYNEKQLKQLAEETIVYYLKSLNFLDQLSKAFGFKTLSFWQPSPFIEEKLTEEEAKAIEKNPRFNSKPFATLYQYAHSFLMSRRHPHLVDLSKVLQGRRKSYYIDFCHLTEEGNEAIASKMAQTLKHE